MKHIINHVQLTGAYSVVMASTATAGKPHLSLRGEIRVDGTGFGVYFMVRHGDSARQTQNLAEAVRWYNEVQ